MKKKVVSADNTPEVMLQYRLRQLLRAERITVPRRLSALLGIYSRCGVWMRKKANTEIF